MPLLVGPLVKRVSGPRNGGERELSDTTSVDQSVVELVQIAAIGAQSSQDPFQVAAISVHLPDGQRISRCLERLKRLGLNIIVV